MVVCKHGRAAAEHGTRWGLESPREEREVVDETPDGLLFRSGFRWTAAKLVPAAHDEIPSMAWRSLQWDLIWPRMTFRASTLLARAAYPVTKLLLPRCVNRL